MLPQWQDLTLQAFYLNRNNCLHAEFCLFIYFILPFVQQCILLFGFKLVFKKKYLVNLLLLVDICREPYCLNCNNWVYMRLKGGRNSMWVIRVSSWRAEGSRENSSYDFWGKITFIYFTQDFTKLSLMVKMDFRKGCDGCFKGGNWYSLLRQGCLLSRHLAFIWIWEKNCNVTISEGWNSLLIS